MFTGSDEAFGGEILSVPDLMCFWSDVSFEVTLLLYTLGPLIFIALLIIPVAVAWARGLHRQEEAELPLQETEQLPHSRWNKTMDNFWTTTSEWWLRNFSCSICV